MKALLAYFSATGNTTIVVNEMTKVLREHDVAVDLVKIKRSTAVDFQDYDLIGVATPVMSFKPTYVVKDFVNGMPKLPGKMAFAIAVHGGMGMSAHHILANWLKGKKMTVLGALDVWGENSFMPARRPGFVSFLQGHPNRKAMESVRSFGVTTSVRASAVRQGEKFRSPLFIVKPTPLHYMGRSSNRVALRMLTGNKHVDEARCTKCGFCAEHCPVDAISLTPYPSFNTDCFGCWSCINNCPEEAILTASALGGVRFPGGCIGPRPRICHKCAIKGINALA